LLFPGNQAQAQSDTIARFTRSDALGAKVWSVPRVTSFTQCVCANTQTPHREMCVFLDPGVWRFSRKFCFFLAHQKPAVGLCALGVLLFAVCAAAVKRRRHRQRLMKINLDDTHRAVGGSNVLENYQHDLTKTRARESLIIYRHRASPAPLNSLKEELLQKLVATSVDILSLKMPIDHKGTNFRPF